MTRDVLALVCVVLGIAVATAGAAVIGGPGVALVVGGAGLFLLGILFGMSA